MTNNTDPVRAPESMTGELLPCPFCGHTDQDRWPCEWLDSSGTNVIRCAWCHGAAPAGVWNRRTLASAPPSAPTLPEFSVGVDVTRDGAQVVVLRCEGDLGEVIYSALHPLPAAPSGEAVAWAYPDELREKGYDALHRLYGKPGDPLIRRIPSGGVPIYAAPQQPAGVNALEVFRIAGGDTECEPNPTPERALEVLRDLRACYDEAIAAQQQGGADHA